jgi:hypothetical protein
MRSLVLIVLCLAAAAWIALPGPAAEEGAIEEVQAAAPATVGARSVGATPAASVVAPPGSKALPPRLDSRTRDLLVMAALVCVLLASLLLNASAFRRRPAPKRPRRPPEAATERPSEQG